MIKYNKQRSEDTIQLISVEYFPQNPFHVCRKLFAALVLGYRSCMLNNLLLFDVRAIDKE